MMPRRALLLALVPMLALAACSGLLPKPPPAPQLYRLTPAAFPAAGAPIAAQLLVDPPGAAAAIDTARIALSRGPTRVDYFADAAWVDRAPLMLQSLMVESLTRSGRIAAVAPDTLALRADAVLMTELQHFEAEYAGTGPPRIRITLDCRLVRMSDRSIFATRSFTVSVPVAANALPAIVGGFNAAFHDLMHQLAPWVAASLAAHAP